MSQGPATITCPRCHRTSAHPRDVEAGYCGYCHAWTSAPASPVALTVGVRAPEAGAPPRLVMEVWLDPQGYGIEAVAVVDVGTALSPEATAAVLREAVDQYATSNGEGQKW